MMHNTIDSYNTFLIASPLSAHLYLVIVLRMVLIFTHTCITQMDPRQTFVIAKTILQASVQTPTV